MDLVGDLALMHKSLKFHKDPSFYLEDVTLFAVVENFTEIEVWPSKAATFRIFYACILCGQIKLLRC